MDIKDTFINLVVICIMNTQMVNMKEHGNEKLNVENISLS